MAKGDKVDATEVTDVESASDFFLGLLTEKGPDAFSATDEDEKSQEQESEDEEAEGEDDEAAEEESGESDDTEGESDEDESGEEDDVEEDGDEEEEPEPKPVKAASTFDVKVAGKVEKVTLDELKQGYSRTADYQRKTQALATERKAFEAEQAAVRAERGEYTERLTMLEEALEAALPEEPDWETLRKEDPQEYAVQHTDFQRKKEQLAKVSAERQRSQQKQFEDAQTEYVKTLTEERVKLREAIPEWSDEKQMAQQRVQMAAYAEDLGYSKEQLALVTDHRVMVMLRKAMLYDAGKATVKKGVKPAVKTLKPGGKVAKKPKKVVKESRDAMQRLRKSGSQRDAQALFRQMDWDKD